MEEYNGTIDLISGLRPKNDGEFPLMRARDVAMPSGTRVSDEISTIVSTMNTYPVIDGTQEEGFPIVTLLPERHYAFGEIDSLTISSLQEPADGRTHEFCFEFIPSASFTDLVFESDEIKWAVAPQFPAGKTCLVSIERGIGVIVCA